MPVLRGKDKDGTPERNWRPFSKDTTPERNWRPGSINVGTPERVYRPPNKDLTPERSWRSLPEGSQRTSRPLSKDTTPERGIRSLPSRAIGSKAPLTPSTRLSVPGPVPVQLQPSLTPSSSSLEVGGAAGESVIQSLVRKGFLASSSKPWGDDPTGVPDDLVHVRSLFAAQVPGAPVRGIYRVENGGLGVVYGAVRAAAVSKKERNLWHGTSLESVRNITLNGFNRAYCGRHGMKYGHGTYFSAAADYSVRFCDRRQPQRVMFFAKVLVGESAKGSPELVEPPHRDDEGMQRYDSTVDDVESPNIFCIFRDFQAIPLYLVEFGCPGP